MNNLACGGDAPTYVPQALGHSHLLHLFERVAHCHFIVSFAGQGRLMLAGLFADLAYEHGAWVRQGDQQDLPVESVLPADRAFVHRVSELFLKGTIMSAEGKGTFTAEVVKFLKTEPKFIFAGDVVALGLPKTDAELFAPLERIRKVVRAMIDIIPAFVPHNLWSRSFHMMAFPNCGLGSRGEGADGRPALRDRACSALRKIGREANIDDPARGVQELLKLAPSAEKYFKSGCNSREAWGRASRDFPELDQGRMLVSLFVACLNATGDTERTIKEITFHHCKNRRVILGAHLTTLPEKKKLRHSFVLC